MECRPILDRMAVLGLKEDAVSFFSEAFRVLVDEKQGFGGTILGFNPALPLWDATISESPARIREALREYLVSSTTESMTYFPDRDVAARSVRIFEHMWLGKISVRALKTLYAGLAGGVGVSMEYLQAVEAVAAEASPLASSHDTPTIYWKRVGDDGDEVMETVKDTSTRPEVLHWAMKAVEKVEPDPETVRSLETVWGCSIHSSVDLRPLPSPSKAGAPEGPTAAGACSAERRALPQGAAISLVGLCRGVDAEHGVLWPVSPGPRRRPPEQARTSEFCNHPS